MLKQKVNKMLLVSFASIHETLSMALSNFSPRWGLVNFQHMNTKFSSRLVIESDLCMCIQNRTKNGQFCKSNQAHSSQCLPDFSQNRRDCITWKRIVFHNHYRKSLKCIQCYFVIVSSNWGSSGGSGVFILGATGVATISSGGSTQLILPCWTTGYVIAYIKLQTRKHKQIH